MEMEVALEEEIIRQMQEDNERDVSAMIEKWKNSEIRPSVRAYYDMKWQKRSSGRRYDSMTGHGLLIGHHTQKVLAYVVKSKDCITCRRHAYTSSL